MSRRFDPPTYAGLGEGGSADEPQSPPAIAADPDGSAPSSVSPRPAGGSALDVLAICFDGAVFEAGDGALRVTSRHVRASDGPEDLLPETRTSDIDILILSCVGFAPVVRDTVERLRTRGSTVPIVVVHEDLRSGGIVELLNAGADCCVHHSTAPAEIVSLTRAVVRGRSWPSTRPGIVRAGEIVVDGGRFRAWRRGVSLSLTKSEFLILAVLAENADSFVTRECIMERVASLSRASTSNVVDRQIKGLRRRLGHVSERELIATKRGVGYMLLTTARPCEATGR